MASPASPDPLSEILADALAPWCRANRVRLLVLYGSRAKGTHRPDSDLDLALWPEDRKRPEARTLLDWVFELGQLTGHEVGLALVTPTLDPVLGREIGRHGKVLYEAEPGIWSAEKLRLWHLFNDARPWLRREAAELQEWAARKRRERGLQELPVIPPKRGTTDQVAADED